MANIQRLLSKTSWTGKELGQIALTNFALDYDNAKAGKKYTPIVDPAVFRQMLNTVDSAKQAQAYNGYISIQTWLSIKVNMANVYYQAAQLNFRKLSTYIEEAAGLEDVYRYIERLPVIMTQKQYEDMKSTSIEAFKRDKESGKELNYNIFALICNCVSFYLRKLREAPQADNPLKAIRQQYVSQPVKSNLVLSKWNTIKENGYFTIEDGSGRRSDTMSGKEWGTFLNKLIKGNTLDDMEAVDGLGQKLEWGDGVTFLYCGKAVDFISGTGKKSPVKWHTYEEPPKDLTKWDVIEHAGQLLHYFYPADVDGSGDKYSHDNFSASMQDFYSEFKELADFALQDMDKTYFSGSKLQAANIPVEEWEYNTITAEEAYNLDFYGAKEAAANDEALFGTKRRAVWNGIAILRPYGTKKSSNSIDERGYYEEPNVISRIREFTLEAFFPESKQYKTNVQTVRDAREQLIFDYYQIMGFNKQVDIIASHFGIPELRIFKLDLQRLANRGKSLEALVHSLYRQIKLTSYNEEDLQPRKLKVLTDFFQPLNLDELSIPEANVAKAKELFKDFYAFGDGRYLFDSLLCYKPQTEGDNGEGA